MIGNGFVEVQARRPAKRGGHIDPLGPILQICSVFLEFSVLLCHRAAPFE